MVNFGDKNISNISLGDAAVKAVYLGDVLVWPEGTPPTALFALKFTMGSDGSWFTVAPVGNPSSAPDLEYSTDGGTTWDTYTVDTTVGGDTGDVVYMRASATNLEFSTSSTNYYRLETTGNVRLEGKLISLMYSDPQDGGLGDWFFNKFLGDATNSSNLTVDLDFSGATSLGQGALSEFAKGITFASGSKVKGFDQISSIGNQGMLSAFAGSNIGGNVELTSL